MLSPVKISEWILVFVGSGCLVFSRLLKCSKSRPYDFGGKSKIILNELLHFEDV